MKIDIPLPCPKCSGKMYVISYDAVLKILKRRNWHICKSCGFERDVETFKKTIWCN